MMVAGSFRRAGRRSFVCMFCYWGDLARGREHHFRTGKRADNLDATLFRLPVLALPFSPKGSLVRSLFRWFSRRDQNAWDSRKFCAYKRDNAVCNYFRTHFQDNLVHFFVSFGVFWKIYRFIYAGFPKGNNRWQATDPRF